MPTPATLLLFATLLPLAAFGLLASIGRRMGTLGGYIATGISGCGFVLSVLAMISWYSGAAAGGAGWGFGKLPIDLPLRWIPIGTSMHPEGLGQDNPGWLDVGIYIDSLTISMFAMLTLLSTIVHIYSLGYMKEDSRYARFFASLGLFCFSMLGLVLGATLLHLLIFWELTGLASYLLVGFWFEKKRAGNAAIKSFLVNRVGDVGLLIGIGILINQVGNLTWPHLWLLLGRAGTGKSIQFGDGTVFTSGWLTAVGIALLAGAIARCAQFPLQSWLVDAMEAPIPASALVHGTTLVGSGIYLLARIFPMLTPDAKLVAAIVGVITLTAGALIAMVQTDIRKVLAYSTVSQLGLMLLAIGVGSWVGGLFHLMTHSFFKALLFLAAGSVIRVARDKQDLTGLGGLLKKIPVTAITFLIGVLAISGIGYAGFGLSGYYSSNLILAQTGAYADLASRLGHTPSYLLLYSIPLVIAYLTPFYALRCWMMTFWGRRRSEKRYDDEAELPIMWGAMLVLAILAALSGRMLSIKEMLEGSLQESNNYCRQFDPGFIGFDTIWPGELPVDRGTDARGNPEAMTISQAAQITAATRIENRAGLLPPVVGLLAAFLLYYRGLTVAEFFLRIPPVRWVRQWLLDGMYFDEMYSGVLITSVHAVASAISWLDRKLFAPLADESD